MRGVFIINCEWAKKRIANWRGLVVAIAPTHLFTAPLINRFKSCSAYSA